MENLVEKRKKIIWEKKKRERELLMKCDICQLSHFNEVFILRKERFSKRATRGEAKARRVCWGCAGWLFSNRKYNFGTSWRNLFFFQRHVKEKNREKYMVIHA